MIHQTKTIQINITINYLLADLLIRQTFFRQMPEKSQFAKLFPRHTSRYRLSNPFSQLKLIFSPIDTF